MADDDARMEKEGHEGGEEQEQQNGGGKNGNGDLMSQLLRKEVLIPVGASAASAGLAWAVRKGGGLGDLVDKVKGKGEDMGEDAASKMADKGADKAKQKMEGSGGMAGLAGKLMPGGSDDDDGEGGEAPEGRADPNTRRLPIQRWTDVAAPVERVYEAWTDFEEYPEFMHRVLSVELEDDDDEKSVKWSEKIWFSTRQWEAEITEMVPNERIAWKTKSGTKHHGVVTFHRLDDKLTRVLVTVDFHPTGMLEKMASGLRFVKRAVQSDLARFKAYVELELQMEEEQGAKGRSGDDGEQERSRGSKQKQKQQRGQQDQEQDGSSPEAREGDSDDDDAEAEREERAARREKRREQTTA
jgi:uncharacterized membrane protein